MVKKGVVTVQLDSFLSRVYVSTAHTEVTWSSVCLGVGFPAALQISNSNTKIASHFHS